MSKMDDYLMSEEHRKAPKLSLSSEAEDELDDILTEILRLWDGYCDEMSLLEHSADWSDFLSHEKVEPIKAQIHQIIDRKVAEARIDELVDVQIKLNGYQKDWETRLFDATDHVNKRLNQLTKGENK